MAYSSERKQALVGWFVNNSGFTTNVQLQKFLFFYELFSKIDGDSYELDGLKGYKNGPVFSAVFGDIKYDENFKATCGRQFQSLPHLVNEPRAKLSDFLVKCLGNKLSEFTHQMNIWAVKRDEIEKGGYQIPLSEDDFTEKDADILRAIETAYPNSYIDAVETYSINGKTFVYYKADKNRLSDRVYDVLNEVSFDPDFDSPVYISFSETGELLLD